MEFFDATGASAANQPRDPAALDPSLALETPQAAELRTVMAEVEEVVDRLDGLEDGECPPDMAARMHSLCADDRAPLEWVSILRRVEAGTQSWARIWAHPRREEDAAGLALVRSAVSAGGHSDLAQLNAVLAAVQAPPGDPRRDILPGRPAEDERPADGGPERR